MRLATGVFAAALVAVAFSSAQADHHMETVLSGLNNPSGVTIQPETNHVFVSDSGAKKVIRVVDGKAEDVITDFPIDVYGKGPKYNIGPLGLAFISKDILVVGGGGLKDGEELLRVYKIPAAGEEPIKADKMEAKLSLPPTEEIKGEGNFYGVAATKDAIYVTCNGDDTKGWISKADIKDGKVGPFKRFLPTKEKTEVDAPVAITISPRGELVVGQMGEVTVPGDSLLTFYGTDGEMLLNLETQLSDITALGYSKKGQLFATDFAWAEPGEGGLFKLVGTKTEDGKKGVKLRKIEKLDKPSAMVFDSEGALYITVFGTPEGDKPGGKLLKIKADAGL